MKNGTHHLYETHLNKEFAEDEISSSALCEEMRVTFGALRQLTKEVKDILVVTNRELNEAVLWNLGQEWCDSDESPKRPAEMRTLLHRGKQHHSGSIGRSSGRSPR
jgi:hypothetical protein